MDPKVDAFLQGATRWQDEMARLRAIALDAGLSETIKWGKPCFTAEGGNIAIVQPFKDQCALLFFKGALLDDPDGLLERPGPNSHVGRRMMFASVCSVEAAEPHLRRWIDQAVQAEAAGRTVEAPKHAKTPPDELIEMYAKVPGLEDAFLALTPGRQRAYLIHFSSAKQSKTRTARIERCVPKILDGKGPND